MRVSTHGTNSSYTRPDSFILMQLIYRVRLKHIPVTLMSSNNPVGD